MVHDPLRNLEQMLFIAETDRRDNQLTAFLDIGLFGAVHHNIGDFWIAQQFFQGAKAQQFVDQHFFKRKLLAPVQCDLELSQDLQNDWAEFLGQFLFRQRRGCFWINPFEQAGKDLLFDFMNAGFKAADLSFARMVRVHPIIEARHRVISAIASRRWWARVRDWRELFPAAIWFVSSVRSTCPAATHGFCNAELRTRARFHSGWTVFPTKCAHEFKPLVNAIKIWPDPIHKCSWDETGPQQEW